MLINKMRGLGTFFPFVSLLFKRIEAVFLFHSCCCSNPLSSAPTFFLLANTNLICNENIAAQTTLPTTTSIIFHQTITRKSSLSLLFELVFDFFFPPCSSFEFINELKCRPGYPQKLYSFTKTFYIVKSVYSYVCLYVGKILLMPKHLIHRIYRLPFRESVKTIPT